MIYGRIEFTGKSWRFVKSEPEVRQRIRRLFIGARGQGDVIEIPYTSASSEDVEWIIDRYQHEADDGVIEMLKKIASAAREAREEALQTLRDAHAAIMPASLVLPLRDYQKQAVQLGLLQGGLLLADVVGLGKSASAIGLMVHEQCRPALVVCQTHLQFHWKEEIEKFAPSLAVHIVAKKERYKLPDHDVAIISYAKLQGWIDENRWKSVVYDECQELRRADSLKTKTAHYFAKKMDFRMGLSATPIFNYPIEAHTILEALKPGELGTAAEFCKEWEVHEKGMADPDALGNYLQRRQLVLRRTRVDVGRQLPPVQNAVNMMTYDAKVMKRLEKESLLLARVVLQGKFTERGQAARNLDIKLRQATGIAKAHAVAEFVADIVSGGEKVILGGWHREVYNIWNSVFRKRGIKAVMYTGEESVIAKDAAKKKFCVGDAMVMMMSLRSGAGLNGLQDVCCTAVSGELDWTPKIHEQFVGRLARDGQSRPVDHFYCMMNNGSDPVIASVLGLKEAISCGIVDPGVEVKQTLQTNDQAAEGGRGKMLAEMWIKRHGEVTNDFEVDSDLPPT